MNSWNPIEYEYDQLLSIFKMPVPTTGKNYRELQVLKLSAVLIIANTAIYVLHVIYFIVLIVTLQLQLIDVISTVNTST